jgi:hypothetical protein
MKLVICIPLFAHLPIGLIMLRQSRFAAGIGLCTGLCTTIRNVRIRSLRGNFADYYPIRIGDERERLVTASPVMTKSWGLSWEKQLPGERPRETDET